MSSQKPLHICESGPTTERGARARPQASLLERMKERMMPHTLAASVFERITKPLLLYTSVEKNGGYSWDKWLQVWPLRTDLLHGHGASQGMSSLLDTGTQSAYNDGTQKSS